MTHRFASARPGRGGWAGGLVVCAMLAPLPAGATATGAGEESLTVTQCVALARLNAPAVRALAAGRLAASLDSAAVALNRRPAFAVKGGVLVAPSGFYDPVVTNLGEYRLKLGMDLPILDAGERQRARSTARLSAAGAAVELERAARDAGERAAEVALGILRLRALAQSDREALDWIGRLSSLITSGVRSGAQDRSAAVRARLERDAVESDLLTLDENEAALEREIAELTGCDPGSAPRVAEPDSVAEAPPTPADSVAMAEWVERAPEVQAARAEEASARLALEAARRRSSLRVDLALDAGLWGADLTRAVPEALSLERPGATFGDRLRRDLGGSLSLEFRRPVLDAAASRSVSASEESLRAALGRTAAALASRRRAALDVLGRWRASSGRFALARASLGRAEEHLLRERSLYAGGAVSLLELLDARRQVDEARARIAETRFETQLARWEGELQR